MRVFVAGASGAIGRPLIERLLTSNHHVVGSTRTEDGADWLRDAGVVPVVVDLTDLDLVGNVIAAALPDVVINQLTSLPAQPGGEAFEEGLEATAHLRSVVAPAIAKATVEAGASRLITQSTAFAASKGQPAIEKLERSTLQATGIDGVVLRYGYFYGPGTWYETRPDAGPNGDKKTPFVHVDDAATAAALAVDKGDPGAYVVSDDATASADARRAFGWKSAHS